jgi:lipoprotein-releasing system ATP-binding protein
MNKVLDAKNICKSYGDLHILNDVSLEVAKGEVISIVGPSGAGKSTLLHILGTLDLADSGSLIIDNQDLGKIKKSALPAFRNQKIGFIFQFHHLLPEFTAVENVCIPAFIAGKSKKETSLRAIELLKMLKIEHRANHKPSELSGGEQQRVAVARALINSPTLILADEPSGNLDTENAKALHELFFELRNSIGLSFIIVTHNEELANMTDRKITMRDGKIIS